MRFCYLVSAIILLYCPNLSAENCSTSVSIDRFDLNTNGTVTDIESGLSWSRCSIGQVLNGNTCTGTALSISWSEALKIASNANTASLWRLPELNELATIIDTHCLNPRIHPILFPNTPSNAYWSKTGVANDITRAYALGFDRRGIIKQLKTQNASVRLIQVEH